MQPFHFRSVAGFSATVAALFLAMTGCTVHPPGEREEKSLNERLGKRYETPPELRMLPPLPDNPTPEQLVNFALLSNADLEQRYWQWRSALEQVPQEGTQQANLMISYSTMISNGTTAAGENTIGAANGPMNSLVVPDKLKTAATIALENAKAAGKRFDKARFELRNKVLWAYDDYALTAEFTRLEQNNLDLLELIVQVTRSRFGAGVGLQQDLLKASNELDISKDELAALQSQLPQQRARLNALLNRPPGSPLTPPAALPAPRTVPGDEADLLLLVARNNPELRALANETTAKAQAIRRAKQEYWPDIGVNVSTDLAGTAQSLMGSLMLPLLRYPSIDARIRQAESDLHANEALRRQTENDLASRVVGDLAMLHDAQRQAALYEQIIIPRAETIVSAMQRTYTTGQTSMLDLVDAQRSLITLRRMLADLKMTREKQIADLEAAAALGLTSDAAAQP